MIPLDSNSLKRFPGILLSLWLGCSCANAGGFKIVAFGDSTTAFRKGKVEKVYSIRLQEALAEKGIDAEVVNEGVGGSHTGFLTDNKRHKRQHARDRFQEKVLSRKPDVVIMQFEINDSYVDQGGQEGISRIPLEKYHGNLIHMVGEMKRAGIGVILMTSNPFGASKEEWRHERLREYAERMRLVAREQDVPLVDVWEMYGEYAAENDIDNLLLDGVHPNDAGHQMLTERLLPVVLELLKTSTLADTERLPTSPFRGNKK